MNDSVFPQRRADGSFSVAIRYLVSQEDAVRAAQSRVSGWMQRKILDGLDVTTEFSQPPRVDRIDPQTMQIVLNCPQSSVLWKGLMVELAQDLSTIDGIRRLGFWDLVTGLAHPASLA
jgi:hypothetical protein